MTKKYTCSYYAGWHILILILPTRTVMNKPLEIINDVIDSIKRWPEFAFEAGVREKDIVEIAKNHRIHFN